MKKILGLDLGSSSIGWVHIVETNNSKTIKKIGVRIIPIDSSARDAFAKGQSITINEDRTLKRTSRKTNHRYKLRKKNLVALLSKERMMPDEKLLNLSSFELYQLRHRAVSEKIDLKELGRIFYQLNQKRGYRSSRKGGQGEESGKKLSDYLQEIKERKDLLEANQITIGQYFYRQLQKDPWFKIKQNVFPRECYIEEFEKIWEKQSSYYPDILSEQVRKVIRDRIIFYQRPLKSAKWLVRECRFEKHHKAAPISSPLFQVEKIWESIHNITLTNKRKENYPISSEEKQKIFEYLDSNERISASNLFKILKLRSTDGWYANEQIRKSGLSGNTTKSKLIKEFKELGINREDLLQFNLEFDNNVNDRLDESTGELIPGIVSDSFEKAPLYQLWHVLYSIEDPQQTVKTLVKRFGLEKIQAEGLSKLDFTQNGFGSKSAKAIRKVLPALMLGRDYTRACQLAGYNHSESITTEENETRELSDKLKEYKRNSLRQPVVEKVLNQLVNVVNSILEDNDLGRPDEIRVELARDLKQSKEEREKTYDRINETDRLNKSITERLNKEFPGLSVTRKVLEKYKLYEEQNGRCLYSGENIPLSKALTGDAVDVDHIIPRSRLFDDSFQNKVLAFRKENEKKDNATAFDYLSGKGEDSLQRYLEGVNRLFEMGKITKSKRNKLLLTEKEIPDDFINRQLNESRFIAREAVKLLKTICRNVTSTTGAVTEFLRHQWGYNEVLKQLNWSKYEEAGLVKDGKIEGWSKRDDHRHHAIDALVVACTKQSFIQKLNTLNSNITRDQLLSEVTGNSDNGWQAKRSLLEQSIYVQQPFTTQEVKDAVSQILISFKPGKKVSTLGKNDINGKVQRTLTPRGQLHKETVYGKIRRYSKEKAPLNGRFRHENMIVNDRERELVQQRLNQFGGDPRKAFKDLNKNPIWLDSEKSKPLTAVTVWEEFFVVKYMLDNSFKEKDADSIIDSKIRSQVKKRFDEKGASALKDLENDPIWLNEARKIPIKSVRCFTGLTELVPLHKAENGRTTRMSNTEINGKPVDFVSTRNNHHIAIYKTANGDLEERSVTLWESVVRKNLGIPVIVTDPKKTWDFILEKGIDHQEILSALPDPDWIFIESLQQNEMFVFRMSREELEDVIRREDYATISPNLYRVQKIAEKYYVFRHHLETKLERSNAEEKLSIAIGKMIRIQSLEGFKKHNPLKVVISHTGKITLYD